MRWALLIAAIISCSYTGYLLIPQDAEHEITVQDSRNTPAVIEEDISQTIQEVTALWKEEKQVEATHKIELLYKRELKDMFALLYDQNGLTVMAAEHQVGWVLHRLKYKKSSSFKREKGYLQKLHLSLDRCVQLLPEPQVASSESTNAL